MITDWTYSNLLGNSYYRFHRNVLYTGQFDELMIQMLILMSENGSSFQPGLLHLIKTLKDRTGYGLKDLKEFIDLLIWLEVIDRDKSHISDYIYIINSIRDVVCMIDNRMDVKMYSRKQKLNRIKTNISDKT